MAKKKISHGCVAPDTDAANPCDFDPSGVHAPGRPVPPQTVWYRLHKLTNLLSRPFFTHFARPFALNHNAWPLLMTLAVRPNSAAHELAEMTGLHPMNVSRAVAVLRRQGRIREKRDPTNGRRKLLTLTPKGWAVYEALKPHLERTSALLFVTMPAEDVETLSRLIDRLIARVEEIDAASVGLPPEAASTGNQPSGDLDETGEAPPAAAAGAARESS